MTLSEIHVYPVKSCRGIALDSAEVGRMGIRYDRQWMFVDERGMFLAQRSDRSQGVGVRTMCLIRTRLTETTLQLTAPDMPPLDLPLTGLDGTSREVSIWGVDTVGIDQGDAAAEWADTFLNRERPGRYRLVRMPDEATRLTTTGTATLAYADGYSFLAISEASLADLNARLDDPLPMNRFRPNLVLRGAEPYAEDHVDRLRIGGVEFQGMTLCARCPIPTTDQDTAERRKEPLRTLATYRRIPKGVVFGRNLNHIGTGRIQVGDAVVPVP